MAMRRVLAAAAVVAFPMVAEAQQPAGPPPPASISVSANGETRVTPDRAYVTVGVMTRASTAQAAGSENARKQKAILDTLKALGLKPEQLTTTGYSVQPDMRYDQKTGETSILGYTVRNNVRAEVRRIDQVGPVIDAALKKGSNEIQGIAFFSSQADSARRVALANAVALARADAEVLAHAAGGTLGELMDLSTSGAIRPMAEADYRGGVAMKAMAAPTPVEPGEQSIQAYVAARWRFVPR